MKGTKEMTTPHLTRRSFIGTLAALAATRSIAADTNGWQLGCFTRPWAAHGLAAALDGIAEAGFKYAGLMSVKSPAGNPLLGTDTPLEEAAAAGAEVRKRGLKTIATYGAKFDSAKSIPDAIAALKRLLDNCAACECPNLLLGGTSAEQAPNYYKAVRECCDYAATKNVIMVLKPHGGGNATGPECRKLVEQVGHKHLRLWYDPGNIFYYSDAKIDPAADSTTVDGIVSGMCVKDFLPPKIVDVTPGTGRVNFPKVIANLRRGGFTTGPLVVECLAKGDLPAINAEAKKARQFLEQLTKSS